MRVDAGKIRRITKANSLLFIIFLNGKRSSYIKVRACEDEGNQNSGITKQYATQIAASLGVVLLTYIINTDK